MKYKVQITDEDGNVFSYNITTNSNSEKTLNDFILEALHISENKRELPVKVICPNGLEVAPTIQNCF